MIDVQSAFVTTKVTVVIPVWNPGKYIDRCVSSLLEQTMPTSEFEVLFMDDGSTDGTETALDRLAERYAHFTVHHLPNSGWPGKPRNLGIQAAQGSYVLFMDNDDALGPEALERMYEIAARNEADIVLGKVISDFRGVPHQVFRRTRERCSVQDAPLFESLTPHKMFRRRFLLDNDIKYPEGKRRLEDQLIMARAYFPARSVSIVGDYPCYFYLKRDDGKNAGSARIEPKGYYNNLREVLDVVHSNTEPGEFRDSILRRFYRGEMLGRLTGKAVLNYQPHFRDELFNEIRSLALESRFSPAVHDGLPALLRVRSYFVREDRVDDLLTFTERCADVRLAAKLERMQWSGGTLNLNVRTGFTYRGNPLQLVREDSRLLLSPEVALDTPADQRDCTGQLEDAKADVTIKSRDTSVEFFLPAALTLEQKVSKNSAGQDVVCPEWAGEVKIDASTAYGGRPLPRGVWDVSVRLNVLGLSREIRLGRERAGGVNDQMRPGIAGDPARAVIPYFTNPYGNLSIDVDEHSKSLKTVLKQTIEAHVVRIARPARLRLDLPIALPPEHDLQPTMRLIERSTARAFDAPLTINSKGQAVQLVASLPRESRSSVTGISPGTWDIALTVPGVGWTKPVRIGPVLHLPKRGPMWIENPADPQTVEISFPPWRDVVRALRKRGVATVQGWIGTK